MPELITSRDNALLKVVRKLAQDSQSYKKLGQIWIEGDHLCRAALNRGLTPAIGIYAESIWPGLSPDIQHAAKRTVLVPDRLFKELSGLESPAQFGFVLERPVHQAISPEARTIVLDRVQDAGNVGSILRSAAAFDFQQVVAIQGTAALWSPKVLRAGMGAHFALKLIEGQTEADLDALTVPLISTSSHTGNFMNKQVVPNPCAWVFGHEGQGVSAALLKRAMITVKIRQPGGEESLNVAAAAAICLFVSSVDSGPL